MEMPQPGSSGQQALEKALGYLNFGSGTADPQLLASLNFLFELIEEPAAGAAGRNASKGEAVPSHSVLAQWLASELARLRQTSSAFRDTEQAGAVLDLVFGHVLGAYLDFHSDLLHHQTASTLFRPFFIGRVCEAVLAVGGPLTESERIVKESLTHLNDYIGHRPLATLQARKHEPYAYEWVRPIPLFVEGAGVAVGPYRELIERTIELLTLTDEDLLRRAYFDPALMQELALDPRAFDFDHPVNRRPNYHFGQWDPHHIDNKGRYRRFVVQQVTIDALLTRIELSEEGRKDELLTEAAAALAGTMVMASGISGSGPDSHDSTTTLTTLLPGIAAYRDEFYERLIEQMPKEHRQRLEKEAALFQQPFGAARHHLNAQLARRRALQLEHVRLAKVFARMGFAEAARRKADVVPAASARMVCEIDCLLTAGRAAVASGKPAQAAGQLQEIMSRLRRAIECGAVVDPWNILGCDAQFSLFPALENSVCDHRVDELIDLMEQTFRLYSQVWSEAAAVDDPALCERTSGEFRAAAEWWHQFAAHEVGSVEAANAMDAYHGAEHVARALSLWHKAGAAAGDVRFWSPHVEMFDSPQAYALVIEGLLERGDFVASQALLVHWLEHAGQVGFQQGESSFFDLALRWMYKLTMPDAHQVALSPLGRQRAASQTPAERWTLIRRLFDYFEANADEYWTVPEFSVGEAASRAGENSREELEPEPEEDDRENPYGAAYENVVYRDSTDDGMEGQVFDFSQPSRDALEEEARRVSERVFFLMCLAQLWKLAAASVVDQPERCAGQREIMQRWFETANENRRELMRLLEEVARYRMPAASGDHEALLEYDRTRMIKETLLEQTIATAVEMSDAGRLILAASVANTGKIGDSAVSKLPKELDDELARVVSVSAALFSGNVRSSRSRLKQLIRVAKKKSLLYVPLSKGGDPRKIVAARVRRRTIQDLLAWLPRLGLLTETWSLIETARLMEQDIPTGPGAVTEFDDMFEIGYRAMVECIVDSAGKWEKLPTDWSPAPEEWDSVVVSCLEDMTQTLIESWLDHSRTLRLSVLEQVDDDTNWTQLVHFIRRYGQNIFTQHFLNLGNLRAILHQGVDVWLAQLEEEPDLMEGFRLLPELGGRISRKKAVKTLTLILEAMAENYAEYRDYNASTTQSDRGEMLYTLLDFLRLRMEYDRIAWNLRPVVMAHDVLVRRGLKEAARLWRRALGERFGDEAKRFLRRLKKLQKRHAMQMPTVADRLAERFVFPMTVARICALVEPAVRDAVEGKTSAAFDRLEKETAKLAANPSGVGLDAPSWLITLEEEAENVRRPAHERDETIRLNHIVPQRRLSLEEIEDQVETWEFGS